MRRVLVVFLLLAIPSTARAWGGDGHRIVCEIAWQRLTPEAKTMVTDLLRGDEFPLFAESCSWADEVRRTTHEHTYNYHFINSPAGVAGMDWARDCGDPAKRCAPWAIRHFAQVLADRSAAPVERQEALKFLAHFVGDLHQPLHAGRPEDLGGNRVQVDFFGDRGTEERPRNLHSVWDSGILRRGGMTPDDAAALAAAIVEDEAEMWATTDVRSWANESYRLSEEFVYGRLPADGRIRNAYFLPALGISRAQLMKGGVRLAHLLNAAAAGTLRLE